MHPADDTVRAIIGHIRRTDWTSIETAAIAALRRDRSGSPQPDGFGVRASGNGARGGGDDTLTEAAVFARTGTIHDEHHDLIAETVNALDAVAQACVAMTNALGRIDQIAAQPVTTYRLPACAEPWCEAVADTSRKGRCEACYRWRDREARRLGVTWSEIGIVPRARIEERKAREQRRRVHITGPFTGR